MPRYLIVTEAEYLGGAPPDRREAFDGTVMILVEEEDGTLRHAKGADLVEIDRRFPGWLGGRNLTRA